MKNVWFVANCGSNASPRRPSSWPAPPTYGGTSPTLASRNGAGTSRSWSRIRITPSSCTAKIRSSPGGDVTCVSVLWTAASGCRTTVVPDRTQDGTSVLAGASATVRLSPQPASNAATRSGRIRRMIVYGGVVSADRSVTWVVIAAFNEAKVIREVVAGVVAGGWSVVVVDDGSRDDTAAQARVPGAIVLKHRINLGQGAALQTGIDYALRRGAEAIVTFDADGQHDPADIPLLLEALATADIALGSRFLGRVEGASQRRMAMLRTATKVSNGLSGMSLTDAHCGLRAFRAEAAPALRITQDRMAHAAELLRKIKTSGLRVVEVPVTIKYTEHSKSKGQGGIQAVRILFDYFFRP